MRPSPPSTSVLPNTFTRLLAFHVHPSGAAGSEALRRCLAATAHLPPDVRALLAATPPERVTEHGSYWHTQEGMKKVGTWGHPEVQYGCVI